MENLKHTEGNWIYKPSGDANNYFLQVEPKPNTWLMNIQQNGELGNEEQIANIKLILAAPDLLKALDELQHEVSMQCSIGSDPRFLKMCVLWQNAKQAINKATE